MSDTRPCNFEFSGMGLLGPPRRVCLTHGTAWVFISGEWRYSGPGDSATPNLPCGPRGCALSTAFVRQCEQDGRAKQMRNTLAAAEQNEMTGFAEGFRTFASDLGISALLIAPDEAESR